MKPGSTGAVGQLQRGDPIIKQYQYTIKTWYNTKTVLNGVFSVCLVCVNIDIVSA